MYKMGTTKEINIKNRTYYFYNDIIDLDEFDKSKIKADKKDFNDIDIYYLGYEYIIIYYLFIILVIIFFI